MLKKNKEFNILLTFEVFKFIKKFMTRETH